MKRALSVLLALMLLLSGCNNRAACRHSWERTENVNEYTAADICTVCGATRMYTDTESISNDFPETGFKMLRYNWDGYGIGQKEISHCDLGYAIMDCLSKLQETGEIIAHISDDTVDEFACELPIERGTVWIDCGSVGFFRLDPKMTEICRVETHLGEGKVLQMTDTLKELLQHAWYYHPSDYWSGTYENGKVTLRHVYKNDSAVEQVEIENISIQNKPDSKNNRIKLRLLANETKTVTVRLESYHSSDNLGSIETKKLLLVKDLETTVDLGFRGFYDHSYSVSVTVDNTRISLNIDPRDAK